MGENACASWGTALEERMKEPVAVKSMVWNNAARLRPSLPVSDPRSARVPSLVGQAELQTTRYT